MTVGGLVLAAGGGSRFGRPKADLTVGGVRLVDRAVEVLAAGGCEPVVVVSGALTLQIAGASVVHNDDWASGMGSSLRHGLAAMPDDATAAVVVLVDTPWLGAEAVLRVWSAHRAGAQLAVATYDGRRGHPVLLGREHWPAIVAAAKGDVGARAYLAGRTDVVEVDCTGTGDPADVDVPEALPERWA
ncbi:MAG TPA: nucleotidyltransferase family protein [Jiangellaceae bacterium]